MQKQKTRRGVGIRPFAAALPLLIAALGLLAQGAGAESKFEIYGFAMLDMGYETGQSDPDWYDTMRTGKLPAYENQFGEDGRFFAGVRQSRLGFKGALPTDLGELRTTFEFEMFGVGADAGQTTIRLRHAYGELGQFGAGQTWSVFMDPDVFPNSLEYWGPTGVVWFRNVQVRWMPIQGDTRATIALEKPGGSGDLGQYRAEIELEGVQSRFPAPDLSAEYHLGRSWGYVEAAGILRYLKWDDLVPNAEDLSDDALGWGVNLSSNLKTGEAGTLRGEVVYGEGIENYMNEGSDLGVVATDDPSRPFEGKPLPVLGATLFYDYNWNAKWSSTLGYSIIDIDNVEGQEASAFSRGDYALVNLLHHPAKNVMIGIEGQYGRRENFKDDWNVDDFKVQFSAKYSFSSILGGK
jgi:hypothetical protein